MSDEVENQSIKDDFNIFINIHCLVSVIFFIIKIFFVEFIFTFF